MEEDEEERERVCSVRYSKWVTPGSWPPGSGADFLSRAVVMLLKTAFKIFLLI